MAGQDIVKYTVGGEEIAISKGDVVKYLARGNAELTDKEITLFMELCKFQKLNPFTNEAYAIKFGQNFSMVVGYDAFKRRADENPNYRGKKSGIVVQRGDAIVQKEGSCLYPNELLIGGWCRVYFILNGGEAEEYKEVSFDEYNTNQSNWKSKPCMMIEKVAVSQALRAAFPKDYTGLYTAEERGMEEGSNLPPRVINSNGDAGGDKSGDDEEVKGARLVTKDERRELLDRATQVYGDGEAGLNAVKQYTAERGKQSSKELTYADYLIIMQKISADEQEYNAAMEAAERELQDQGE